jgi:hypothetical protein
VVASPVEIDAASAERPVLPDVVLEHLEEYALLSIQRRKLLFSPEILPDQIRDHDERLAAHWDGLVVAEPHSIDLAAERLAADDPWDLFAAALFWIERGNPQPEAVAETIAAAEDEAPAAWREALKRADGGTVMRLLPDPLLRQGDPALQAVLTYGRGWHGPLPQDAIPDLVTSEHAAVRRSVARAVGWSGAALPGVNEILRILGDDEDVEVRRAALWSRALVNPDHAAGLCRNRVHAGEGDAFDVRVLGMIGGTEDLELLTGLLRTDELKQPALRALADLGVEEAVPVVHAVVESEDEAALPAATEALAALRLALAPEAGESMAALWRGSLTSTNPEMDWLRREVPDGFFTAEPEPTAVPGE